MFFLSFFFFLINIAKPGSTSRKEPIFTHLEAPFTYTVYSPCIEVNSFKTCYGNTAASM